MTAATETPTTVRALLSVVERQRPRKPPWAVEFICLAAVSWDSRWLGSGAMWLHLHPGALIDLCDPTPIYFWCQMYWTKLYLEEMKTIT